MLEVNSVIENMGELSIFPPRRIFREVDSVRLGFQSGIYLF